MLYPEIVLEEPQKSSLKDRVKFYRRLELTSPTRLEIAYQAMNARWGKITELSVKYQISRKFVYEQRNRLRDQVEALLGVRSRPVVPNPCPYSLILQLRLIGRSSLAAISVLLKSLYCNELYSSVGYISQSLQQIGTVLSNQIVWQGSCIFASDELFGMGNEPILVTVDVYSGAILRLDLHSSLTKANWENHWTGLLYAGITPLKVLSDEGSALQRGRKTILETVRFQPDTFHAISHRFGILKKRLLQQAEAEIATEYEREKRFFAAKSDSTALKVAEQWQTSILQSQQAIQLYEDFSFLYHGMLKQLNVFNAKGVLRPRVHAEQELLTAVFYLRTLPIKGIQGELDALMKVFPQRFDFLDTAQDGVRQLETFVDFAALPYWIQAWQCQKKAAKIKGQYTLQKKYLIQYKEFIAFLTLFYAKMDSLQWIQLKEVLFKTLDIACS